jgi:large conductance mechanosensitive channel
MLKEFKEFVARGNVMDLAVGVILGAAFGKIVSSLVDDVLMPILGRLIGGVDFTNKFLDLSGGNYATLEEAKKAGAAVIGYGSFLNAAVQFVFLAFVIFLLVRQVNKLRQPAPAVAATTKDCPACCMSVPVKATRCPHCTSALG